MKATHNPATKTKFTTSHRKEGKCFFKSIAVIDLASKPHPTGEMQQPLVARIYGTGAANTACLWINTTNKKHPYGLHVSGSGKAGGYGYHRASAALGEAIHNAGFTLSESISGRGESAMREAMLALAKVAGIKRPAIVESYQ
jgi:hypothetical protein